MRRKEESGRGQNRRRIPGKQPTNVNEESEADAADKQEGRRPASYLLIQGFVVFKQGLERFEDLDFAGDPRGRLSLALDHGHAERALVSGHQALQMLQQELRREGGRAAAEPAPSV